MLEFCVWHLLLEYTFICSPDKVPNLISSQIEYSHQYAPGNLTQMWLVGPLYVIDADFS